MRRLPSFRRKISWPRYLVGRLGIGGIVAGYDFHFGARRAGTPDFLKEAGTRHGFAVEIVDKITHDASGSLDAVSSTAIREALEAGDVRRARELLGHPFLVEGTIVGGKKLGRTLGYPTANIVPDPSCRLKHGIYAVTMNVDGHDPRRRRELRPAPDIR